MEGATVSSEVRPAKLLDRVRSAIRLRHYSPRTEEAYVGWIRRFVIFRHKRHPNWLEPIQFTGAIRLRRRLRRLDQGLRNCSPAHVQVFGDLANGPLLDKVDAVDPI